MEKTEIKKAKKEFRNWLVEYTQCELQKGKDGMTYPCGTCVISLLDAVGLKSRKKEYKEHNKEVDRSNEVWRAILQIRDYKIK